MSSKTEILRPLLDYLSKIETPQNTQWQDWQITPITGGANNLLYRAQSTEDDFAIKFSMRDERDRAGREYAVLHALQQANKRIAPEPILLDRDSYTNPVVVQSWLEGEVNRTPPVTDADWRMLLDHFAAIHSITPDKIEMSLRVAFLNAHSAENCREQVRDQVSRLPVEARPASLQIFVDKLENSRFPDWEYPRKTLLRTDPNIANFVRRPDFWASVDWENSGWGDPAFEIADLIVHAAYMDVLQERWDWVIDYYCATVHDSNLRIRIQTYRKILIVWWLARFARYMYEVPLGLDKRLAQRDPNWQADMQSKYDHYLHLAESLF